MKKLNKQTKILALLLFIIGSVAQTQSFGQQWLNPKDLNPPENLVAEVADQNDVNLFWTAPSTGSSAYLHWDNGENYTSYGNFLGPAIADFAAKWDPDHISAYDGWTITTMRFWVTTPMPTIQLKIWAGPDATEIYSQDVPNFNIHTWTEITLDVPVTIDASTQLWAGLFIDMPVADGVMGCDEGPAINGYGNMTRFNNGVWATASNLNWNIQIQVEEPALPTYLHWDNGENQTSIGNYIVPSEIDFATKWDPDHIAAYDGWTVTKMRFYLTNPTPTVKLKIWTGPGATEIYSQEVSSFAINNWTEVMLDNPVTIDASTQFWVGLNVDMPTTGPVMGADEGPAIDGYSNIYRFNGSWYSDFDNNWNIQFQVEDLSGKAVDGLLGYNIYRDDEQINEDVWGGISFIDENLLNGTYNYHVTAVYDEGESDPSNTVEVVIDQPVIVYADSMALVDLYNNCNGPNWILNDLWLEGPVSEWHGVTTTGTRVTGLKRQSNNLTGDIPESFGYLTALQVLHLEQNAITSIPESIGNLEALTELWLGWTPITTIPESFGNLINLKQLHLGLMEIGLGTLPESFCNLESLEWLALGQAGLNSLPHNFGNLTSLENCFLWGNTLTELPAGFGNLQSLEYLTLDNNQLTTLPESFGNMDNLYYLNIEYNQLSGLPDSFGNLSSMHSLYLANNQLTILPENFGNMNNLSRLDLYYNQLIRLPENFGYLESLDSVYFFNNSLISLPESFGNLSDLNLLSLENNNLTQLPESFGNLATVEEIYLNENQLEVLPENFGNMPEIFLLVLAYNNLTTLPESITELSSLKGLYAGANQLESIPENIGNMGNLRNLAIGFNNITEIPESIGNLSSLGSISLSHNQINALPETFGNLNADTVLIGDNNIHELPSSMFDKYYEYLWVQENALQFGSLEPLMDNGIWQFLYDPQAMIGIDTTITAAPEQTINYTIEVSGENNVFLWYKNGLLITGQNTNTLNLQDIGADDAGNYQLKVTNTVVQELTLESHNLELVVSDCDPWEFTTNSLVHTISVPSSANPSIGGEPLQDGDWIGVFYMNDESVEKCGGASMWNSSGNVEVLAYGNNPFTPEKDGFAEGEAFIWKMYRCSNQLEVLAAATYDFEMPNQGFYANQGSSMLTSLSDGYVQSFDMAAGWNGVSSYIDPANPAVEEILAPVVNDLIIMRNLTQVYWPLEELNTIGDWDNTSGYAIKFTDDLTFDIYGSSMADKTLTVASGWSYLPVPSECDVDVITLFEANQDNIVIVQDLIGTQVYWPEMGVYSLQTLVPGKSYKIKANNEFELTFPECGEKMQPSLVSRKNSINTPWGDLNMTPSTESVVVFAEALKVFETGDMVAAFNQNNVLCGMMEVSNTNQNQSMILFGDDPTTYDADGFTEGDLVSFKLYRTSTGEEFELNVEYLTSMENSTGLYYSNSFAGITNMTTGITSVNEMSENNIKLYPNPAKDHVNIEFATGNDYSANVSIFDAQGRIAMEEIISNGNTQLNVSNLKQGVYIVRITTSNNNKTVKLVIE